MGDCFLGLISIAVIIGIGRLLMDYVFFPNERKAREKGYRERFTYFGGPTYWEPDPTKKGVIPDEQWKEWGYRWSERYHRWYKPKKRSKYKY